MAWVPQRTPFSLVHQRILLRESKTTLAATAEDMSDVGFVLLAGGTGSRMKASMPKQFLTLRESPVLHHSLHLFLERLPEYLKQEGKE